METWTKICVCFWWLNFDPYPNTPMASDFRASAMQTSGGGLATCLSRQQALLEAAARGGLRATGQASASAIGILLGEIDGCPW